MWLEDYRKYKQGIPVYGAILLDAAMEQVRVARHAGTAAPRGGAGGAPGAAWVHTRAGGRERGGRTHAHSIGPQAGARPPPMRGGMLGDCKQPRRTPALSRSAAGPKAMQRPVGPPGAMRPLMMPGAVCRPTCACVCACRAWLRRCCWCAGRRAAQGGASRGARSTRERTRWSVPFARWGRRTDGRAAGRQASQSASQPAAAAPGVCAGGCPWQGACVQAGGYGAEALVGPETHHGRLLLPRGRPLSDVLVSRACRSSRRRGTTSAAR